MTTTSPIGGPDRTPDTQGTEGYRVNIKVYEGPMDLLIYLIKKNEMDIYDVSISEITDQYLTYMGLMFLLNLDLAGEFLVMAAQLLEIKSRMLLPPAEEGAEEGPSPEADLIQKLLEYRKFRDAAQYLVQRDLLNRDVFARKFVPEEVKTLEGEDAVVEANLFDLLTAFKEVMERSSFKGVHEVVRENVSVVDRINDILGLISSAEKITFASLFPEAARKVYKIVTFLSILELIRLKLVKALQQEPFGEIWLVPSPGAKEGRRFSETDLNEYR